MSQGEEGEGGRGGREGGHVDGLRATYTMRRVGGEEGRGEGGPGRTSIWRACARPRRANFEAL